MDLEFEAWPSTPRLFREMTITEKIDGTNAAIIISKIEDDAEAPASAVAEVKDETAPFDTYYAIGAQSRKRLITPKDDNFGFAAWVRDNAAELFKFLGEGRHYGEWWGRGIQRGYGLDERRFSLFNVHRWATVDPAGFPAGLSVVPVLHTGPFSTLAIEIVKGQLREGGSKAAPGFMDPEGVIIWHSAARAKFKSTFDACDAAEHNGGKTWEAA